MIKVTKVEINNITKETLINPDQVEFAEPFTAPDGSYVGTQLHFQSGKMFIIKESLMPFLTLVEGK